MDKRKKQFAGLKALFINCSLQKDSASSHTRKLMSRSARIMEEEGVAVKHVHALDYDIAFGMIKDGTKEGLKDDWPDIQKQIMEANILVIGTPIWLGVKSSVATLVVERMYAYSSDKNEKGQYLYYGKTGGCVITGNEDGIKHCAMDILYALQHIGYTVPPQADCGWLGGVGPGPSYGDTEWNGKKIGDGKTPAGYDSEFTNQNATFMSWNLMHIAKMLKDNGGIDSVGNVADEWKRVTNAENFIPD